MVPGIFTIIEYLNGSPQRFQQKQPWKAESRALTPCCMCTFRVSSSLASVLFSSCLGTVAQKQGSCFSMPALWHGFLSWPLIWVLFPKIYSVSGEGAGAGGGSCSGGLLHRTLVSWEIRLAGARWKWQNLALFGIGCPPGDRRCDIV